MNLQVGKHPPVREELFFEHKLIAFGIVSLHRRSSVYIISDLSLNLLSGNVWGREESGVELLPN